MGIVAHLSDKNGSTHDIAAVQLNSNRTIGLSGDVSGSVSSNLSGNVSISTTIGSGAVTSSKIADSAVTTSKINDGAVTEDKLSSEVTTKLDKAHTHTNKSALDNYAAAGDSTHAVYIDQQGVPHQVDKVASATSADNATNAVNDDRGNSIFQTYATKSEVSSKSTLSAVLIDNTSNIISLAETVEGGQEKLYYWASSSVPQGLPSGISGSGFAAVRTFSTGRYRIECFWQLTAQNNARFVYTKVGSATPVWIKEYINANDSYDSTSDQPISGIGVSAALSSVVGAKGQEFAQAAYISCSSTNQSDWFKIAQIDFASNSAQSASHLIRIAGRGVTPSLLMFQRRHSGSSLQPAVNGVFSQQDNDSFGTTIGLTGRCGWRVVTTDLPTGVATRYELLVYARASSLTAIDLKGHSSTGGTLTWITQATAEASEPSGDNWYLASPFGDVRHALEADSADNATNATNDADGNSITATYQTKNEALEKNFVRATALSGTDNLDNIETSDSVTNTFGGIAYYRWNSSGTPLHTPTSPATGIMEVQKVHGTGGYVMQRVYDTTCINVSPSFYYFRKKTGGSWTAWVKEYFETASTVAASGASNAKQAVNSDAIRTILEGYLTTDRIKNDTLDSTDESNGYTGKSIADYVSQAMSGNVGGYLGTLTPAQVLAHTFRNGDWFVAAETGAYNYTTGAGTTATISLAQNDECFWTVNGVLEKRDTTSYERTSNRKTSLSSNSNSYYPTVKAVKTVTDALDTRVTSVEGRMEAAEGSITELQTTVAGLSATYTAATMTLKFDNIAFS